MYEFEYINTNTYKENNRELYLQSNQMTEQIDKSSSNFSKLEQDIYSLINSLRKNQLEFCNNLIQKNKHKANSDQNEIINFLQEIHSKRVLKPFYKLPELSLAAKSLLNKIILNYKKNHSLNLKELEPTKKNIRARLSKYGERTGKIFETVLFELDNAEDIVNHILKEEKGRNMLLSQEMKFIGISCDLIDSNFMCTVIDIVQDFSPYKENNTNIFSKNRQITEQKIDKSLTKFSKLEQDILSLINYLRKNPLEFCNNLIQKNKHKTNPVQNDIINFLQDIHSKKVLKPFYQISELSLSAKSLLNKIKINYKNNHSLNLKELEPTKKSIRARLSKYGERTGKIFETVLFELDNSEDIVNHILKEEKGRNMLLSNEMKFIGIYCDLIDTNLLCTIIDIVQDFSPFKDNKENNNTSNIKNNINNNILVAYNNNIDNNNYNFNKSNYNRLKQNYFYNQNNNYSNINTEYISLTQNLINNKSSKDNLKLKILQRKKPSEIPMHLGIDLNLNDNFNLTNNNINKKTPKKIIQYFDYKNSNGIFSSIQFNLNNINIKKVTDKRINKNNNNNIYKEEKK